MVEGRLSDKMLPSNSHEYHSKEKNVLHMTCPLEVSVLVSVLVVLSLLGSVLGSMSCIVMYISIGIRSSISQSDEALKFGRKTSLRRLTTFSERVKMACAILALAHQV